MVGPELGGANPSALQRETLLVAPGGRSAESAAPDNLEREPLMPRGDKSSYTDKQKRQARHIEEATRSVASPKRKLRGGPGPPPTGLRPGRTSDFVRYLSCRS